MDFRLYLITNRKLFSAHCELYMALETILEAGVTAIQLREKDLSQKALFDMAFWMRELTGEYHAKLFINDRVDVALSVQADGVHLGQNGVPTSVVRKIAGMSLLVGVSTHSMKEAREAERDGADFITFGPIFESHSKLGYDRPVGIDMLREVKKQTSLPVYGIGGVKLDKVRELTESGADGVALISGILAANNIRETTEEFLRLLQ